MNAAVSNIAWPSGADTEAAELLKEFGFSGVEIAPGKVWPQPGQVSESEARQYRCWWEKRSFSIVAMQALLFGRAELTLFESPAVRRRALEYLARIIQLGGWLGARALVFGSPLHRRVQGRVLKEMLPLACDTFRWLGEQARACGTCFCIEANHSVYGCDFVTTLAEAVELVQHVAHPGFGLHLDAGGLVLTGESLANLSVQPRHYHISEPHLDPVGSADTDHATLARQLVQLGYHGWLSVEMRESPRWHDNLRAALEHARRDYRPILRPRENCDGTAPPDSDGLLPGAGADPGQLQNLPRLAGH